MGHWWGWGGEWGEWVIGGGGVGSGVSGSLVGVGWGVA